MLFYCSVLECTSSSGDRDKLHRFPLYNEVLLPVWIRATNRLNWSPRLKDRICDKHFSNDDYEGSNKQNQLKPNACPVFNGSSYNTKTKQENKKMVKSFDISTSDINSSDLDSDDISSSDNNVIYVSDNNSNSNKAPGLDENDLSLPSSLKLDIEDMEVVDESNLEYDTVSLSSALTISDDDDKIVNKKCAVILCNNHARIQFDKIFYLDFPKNPVLRNTWWKICGRNDTFDSSSKICSIHFSVDDFETTFERRNGQLYKQTIFKNSNIVPTLFLLKHEYTKFTRKRKKNISNHKTCTQTEYLEEDQKCLVTNCQKSVLKDGKTTLFFRFPLNNILLLKRWLDNIKLSIPKPLENDKICSDHFEKSYIKKLKNTYELSSNAIPSFHPMRPFFIDSEKSHINNKSVKKRSFIPDFPGLKFDKLNLDELKVRVVKMPKFDEKSILLKSLKNKMKDQQQQQQILPVTVNQLNSTEKYLVKDERLCKGSSSKINQNNTKNNVSLKKKKKSSQIESTQTKLLEDEHLCTGSSSKTNQNNTKNNLSLKKKKKSSQIESTQTKLLEDTNLIPVSTNSGNACDYLYLDYLQGEDAKQFLSLERKRISDFAILKSPRSA